VALGWVGHEKLNDELARYQLFERLQFPICKTYTVGTPPRSISAPVDLVLPGWEEMFHEVRNMLFKVSFVYHFVGKS